MASPQLYHEDKVPTHWQLLWLKFSSNPVALFGLWFVCLLTLLCFIGPWIAPYSADLQSAQNILLPPSWHAEGSVEYFFGTDDLGRDIFSRLIFGARYTFGFAALITICTLVVGFGLGVISGLNTGLKSSVLSHLLDALLSLPAIVLALLFAAILGPGLDKLFWAVALALLPSIVRAVHNAVQEEIQKEYVLAARLDGANLWQLFRYVILPNITEILVLQATLTFSVALLDIAALGFLRLGAQPPSTEWGSMVYQGLDNILSAPWTVTMPGITILLAVLAVNLIGEGFRTALAAEGK